jgi:hypothetical protein
VLDAVGTNGNNIYNVRTHLMNGQPVVGNDTKASLSLWGRAYGRRLGRRLGGGGASVRPG